MGRISPTAKPFAYLDENVIASLNTMPDGDQAKLIAELSALIAAYGPTMEALHTMAQKADAQANLAERMAKAASSRDLLRAVVLRQGALAWRRVSAAARTAAARARKRK